MEKRFFGVCFAVFIIGIFMLIFCSPKSYVDKYSYRDVKVHIVQSGDTLWEICKENCPKDIDLREYIELVKEVSDKENAGLMTGEAVIIPIISEKGALK